MMNPLAALFVDAIGADEFKRDEILLDAENFRRVCKDSSGRVTGFLTQAGRTFLSYEKLPELGIVWFDHYPRVGCRVRFWMNWSSVGALIAKADGETSRLIDEEDLLTGSF